MDNSLKQTYQSTVQQLILTTWNTVCTDFFEMVKDIEKVDIVREQEESQNIKDISVDKQIQSNKKIEIPTKIIKNHAINKTLQGDMTQQNLSKQNKSTTSPFIQNQSTQTTFKKQSSNMDLNGTDADDNKILIPIKDNQQNSKQDSIDKIDQRITKQQQKPEIQTQQITNRSTYVPSNLLVTKNKQEIAQNQFILDDQSNNKSIDNDFEQYVQRQFHTEVKVEKKRINFEPNSPRHSRLSRKIKHKNRRQETESLINRNQWSAEVMKLKQAKRKKRVLQKQLIQLKWEIDVLQNPEKSVPKQPKMKDMIRIADDSQANMKAILFVRKMNNERKQKQQKMKMYWQQKDQQMFNRMGDMQEVGHHFSEKKKQKKASQIAQRIEQYQKKKTIQKKMKYVNSSFIDKIKKKTQPGIIPQLQRKKSDLKRIRNLSQCHHQSIIEQYNRGIMMK